MTPEGIDAPNSSISACLAFPLNDASDVLVSPVSDVSVDLEALAHLKSKDISVNYFTKLHIFGVVYTKT